MISLYYDFVLHSSNTIFSYVSKLIKLKEIDKENMYVTSIALDKYSIFYFLFFNIHLLFITLGQVKLTFCYLQIAMNLNKQ